MSLYFFFHKCADIISRNFRYGVFLQSLKQQLLKYSWHIHILIIEGLTTKSIVVEGKQYVLDNNCTPECDLRPCKVLKLMV